MKKESTLAFNAFNYTIQILITIMCIYPFYYIFIYSISDPAQAAKGIFLLPRDFDLINYRNVFKLDNIAHSFLISVLRTVIGTVVTVLCSTWYAYAVTKNELYMRKTVYRFLIVTMYFNAGLIPWYLTMKELGLQNNFLLYILPYAIGAFYVVLLKTFIEQLPQALEESAMIDGAGYLTLFTKIVFPLSMPIVATIAVFASVTQWNTWQDNYFLVSADHLQTMQLILWKYLNEAQRIVQSANMESLNRGGLLNLSPVSIKMTITMVVTFPIMLIYPFLQKYYVKGIMMGAVKG